MTSLLLFKPFAAINFFSFIVNFPKIHSICPIFCRNLRNFFSNILFKYCLSENVKYFYSCILQWCFDVQNIVSRIRIYFCRIHVFFFNIRKINITVVIIIIVINFFTIKIFAYQCLLGRIHGMFLRKSERILIREAAFSKYNVAYSSVRSDKTDFFFPDSV